MTFPVFLVVCRFTLFSVSCSLPETLQSLLDEEFRHLLSYCSVAAFAHIAALARNALGANMTFNIKDLTSSEIVNRGDFLSCH